MCYSLGVQFTEMGEKNRTKARTLDSDLSASQGIQPAGRITLVGLSGCKKDNSKGTSAETLTLVFRKTLFSDKALYIVKK